FVFVDEGQDLDEEAFELLKTVSKHVTVCTVSQSPVSYNPIAYYATFGDEHGQARRDAQGAWWFTGDDGAVTLLHPEERASLHLHGNQQMYGQGSNERQLLARLGLQRRDVSLSDVFRCCPYILHLAAQLLEDPEEATGGLNQAQIVQTEKETPLLYQAADFEDEQRRLIEILKVRLVKGEKIAILLPQKMSLRQVYGFARRLRDAGLEVETPEECDFATDLPK